MKFVSCAGCGAGDIILLSSNIILLSLSPLQTCSLPPFLAPAFQTLTQLKQMKELEQEKDSLLAGLEVVERARDWYQGQIHNVTERQRQVGQSSHCTVSPKNCVRRAVICDAVIMKAKNELEFN